MSTWVGLADAEKEIDRLQARVASLADRIQTLYAENERLRERVEEAVREERVRLTELWQDRAAGSARARVAALEEALKTALDNVLEQYSAWQKMRTRVAALEEALQNYGHHTMRCSAWGPGPAHRPCTCGLDAALARPTPAPEGEQG